MFDLLREAVVRYTEDVFESVVARYWDVASVRLEVDRTRIGGQGLYLMHAKCELIQQVEEEASGLRLVL